MRREAQYFFILAETLTHHTIAEFVGTSREIATSQMNHLRRLGLCRYSRKFIDIYVPAMRHYLQQHRVNAPHGVEEIVRPAGIKPRI